MKNSLDVRPNYRFATKLSKRNMMSAGRTLVPFSLALAATTAANAKGAIDMPGDPTLYNTHCPETTH